MHDERELDSIRYNTSLDQKDTGLNYYDEPMISLANRVVMVKRRQNGRERKPLGDVSSHNKPPGCGEAGILPLCTP